MKKPSQLSLDTVERKLVQYNNALANLREIAGNPDDQVGQLLKFPAEKIEAVRREIDPIIPRLCARIESFEEQKKELQERVELIHRLFRQQLIDEDDYQEMCRAEGISPLSYMPPVGPAKAVPSGAPSVGSVRAQVAGQIQVVPEQPENMSDRIARYEARLGRTPLNIMVSTGSTFVQALDLQYKALLEASEDSGLTPGGKQELVKLYRETIGKQLMAGDVSDNISIFIQYHTSLFNSALGLMLAEKFSPAELLDFSNPIVILGWMLMNASQHKGKLKKISWADINSTIDIVLDFDTNGANRASKEDYIKLFEGIESVQPEKDKHHGNMVELIARMLLTRMSKKLVEAEGETLQIKEGLLQGEDDADLGALLDRGIEFEVTSEVFDDLPEDIATLLDAIHTYDADIYKNLLSRVLKTFLLVERGVRRRSMDHETGKAKSWPIPHVATQTIWGGNAERFKDEISAFLGEIGMSDANGNITIAPLVSNTINEMSTTRLIDRSLLIAKVAGRSEDEDADDSSNQISEGEDDNVPAAEEDDEDGDGERTVDLLDEPLDVFEQMVTEECDDDDEDEGQNGKDKNREDDQDDDNEDNNDLPAEDEDDYGS